MPQRDVLAFKNVVILTGAGISAESGVSTFRDKGGIWAKYDYREVATPEGFARNPDKVYEFYNWRRSFAQTVQPNAAHFALARLERELIARGAKFLLVTQNVDCLHEAGGTQNLLHMHGRLLAFWCRKCDARGDWTDDLSAAVQCPACGQAGGMRPDVVWFGETPYQMGRIGQALNQADLFISIGTSGAVYPAASFVADARRVGAHTVELNLEPSEGAAYFIESLHGPAGEVVPAYVDRLLSGF